MKGKSFTDDQIASMKHMRFNLRMSWRAIGKAFGVCESSAHCAVDHAYAAYYRKNQIARDATRKGRKRSLNYSVDATVVPQFVAEDRHRRFNLAPRDLTAAIQNDPLPGYSALDKREARA